MSIQDKEHFRDKVGTITDEGTRNFLHPKKPKGIFYKYRTYVSWLLLTMLVSAPFIKINGNQFLLFDIFDGKYNIFGLPFWPQDFYLLVLSMLVGIVFVVLFTVIFGRIFCGWLCPQTIFLEMVFRKIEYLIEGDRPAQIKLSKQSWNSEKIRKKVSKWIIFYLLSFLIANVFLAYLIGSDELLKYITEGPTHHFDTIVKLLIFSSVFFFIFAWFREQVCIIACPYGRLQSVLLDNKSIIVAYDYKRGENENGRKKFRKNEDRNQLGIGDCIDCHQCVQVCPTGIDIRNGTQLECVNCTACIDACDDVMDKIGFKKGLIRYASEDNIAKGEKFEFTVRIKSYIVVLALLVTTLIALIFMRNNVELNVLGLPGQLYTTKNTTVQNVYTYTLINKTNKDINNITLKLMLHKGVIKVIGNKIKIPKGGMDDGTMLIDIDKADLKTSKEKIKIGVYAAGKLIETDATEFSSPLKVN